MTYTCPQCGEQRPTLERLNYHLGFMHTIPAEDDMTYTPEDIDKLLTQMRYDLTALQAKLTDLKQAFADLTLREPGTYTCHICAGGLELPSARHLVDHLELVHGLPAEPPDLAIDPGPPPEPEIPKEPGYLLGNP